jgi:hypothetical protein
MTVRHRPSLLGGNHWPGILAVAAVVALAIVGDAHAAGDLHVHSGSLPDGRSAVVGPWTGLNSNAPGGTGTYGLSASSMGHGDAAAATLAPPSNLAFVSAGAYRTFSTPSSANHSQPQITGTWENVGWPYTGASGYGGYNGDSGSGWVSVTNPSWLAFRIACVDFDGVAGSCTNGANYLIQRLDLTMNDPEGPTLSGTMSGDLLDGTWKTAATGEVRFTASDLGSGVYRAWLREGSTTHYALVDPSSARCRDAYPANANAYDFVPSALSLVPCRTASTEYAPAFDLSELGDGVHTDVSLGIEDAGGNERTVLTSRTLRINARGGVLPDEGTIGPNGCVWQADGTTCVAPASPPPSGGSGGAGGVTPVRAPAGGAIPTAEPPAPAAPQASAPASRPCNGERCSATARITLKSGTRGSQSIAVRYGGRAHIIGRLEAPDGGPIAGARVDVAAVSDRDGARAAVRGSVKTDAAGQFVYDAPPGLSGAVALSYRMHLDSADEAARYEVRVRMTAGVRLAVDPTRTRNKHSVTFTGRILGSPAGHRKMVELQARSGGRWVTFATARSDGRGRYRYRYRFERTFTRQTYGFRAVVRNETGWPYLTGSSNRVYVTVAP